MTGTDDAFQRIATLDIVRGVAVMGILAMNIIGFAMPFQAYMNPAAYGSPGQADYVSWLFSFIFIDGKMRGLFSFLFGASMLLVIERAEAKEEDGATIHYKRMLWLLFFGLGHYYLVWFGDILIGYAAIGMLAYLFWRMSPAKLIMWGAAFTLFQLLIFVALTASVWSMAEAAAAPGATKEAVRQWQAMQTEFGPLEGRHLADTLALHRGSYAALLGNRFFERGTEPFEALFIFGWETLAYMLLGMAALKTGFLTGGWSDAAYRRAIFIGYGIGIPAYAMLAWLYVRSGFAVPMTFAIVMAGTVPFRPLMVTATGALILVLCRNRGALVERIAAAGRAAFTNYLGTSILMTTLFYGYGLGLFGTMGRAELWLVVFAMWALMLLWSKPWLDRMRYGPFEWLWRSLARGKLQPMRRPLPAG
jgi:uncharacterized protein